MINSKLSTAISKLWTLNIQLQLLSFISDAFILKLQISNVEINSPLPHI